MFRFFVLVLIASMPACKSSRFGGSDIAVIPSSEQSTVSQAKPSDWEFATSTDTRFVSVGGQVAVPLSILSGNQTISINDTAVLHLTDPSLATITTNAEGIPVLKGKKLGKTALEIEFRGRSLHIPIEVSELNFAGITIEPNPITIRKSEKIQLKIMGTLNNGENPVDITSSGTIEIEDKSRAVIDNKTNGLLLAKSEGNTNITFSQDGKVLATAALEIHQNPTIQKSPKKPTQRKNASGNIIATLTYFIVDLKPDDKVSVQLPNYSIDMVKPPVCQFNDVPQLMSDQKWYLQEFSITIETLTPPTWMQYNQVLSYSILNLPLLNQGYAFSYQIKLQDPTDGSFISPPATIPTKSGADGFSKQTGSNTKRPPVTCLPAPR